MRIAQVAPLYESVPPKLYGGTERVVSYLTEELVRQGHQVTLFASGDSLTEAELVPVLTVSCEIGADCNRHPKSYERAWSATKTEASEIRRDTSKIHSSSDEFNRWIARSQSDVEMMIVGNPEPNYPYAGVPWFSTVFGRDGIITALECLWLNPAIARGVLEFLAAHQAAQVDPASESEPGKILHEMRKGEMSALGEVPFRCYYGSVDATPLFVMLAHSYYERTGDRSLIERLWPHLERALKWIDVYGEERVVDIPTFNKELPEVKNSNNSVFHADGQKKKKNKPACLIHQS